MNLVGLLGACESFSSTAGVLNTLGCEWEMKNGMRLVHYDGLIEIKTMITLCSLVCVHVYIFFFVIARGTFTRFYIFRAALPNNKYRWVSARLNFDTSINDVIENAMIRQSHNNNNFTILHCNEREGKSKYARLNMIQLNHLFAIREMKLENQ